MEVKHKHKYINGGKGVISLLLALLTIPFIMQADVLIESARYHAIVSALDQIMDISETSVLSNYDNYLMNRFGLAAVSQDIDIDETYNDYFNSNLGGKANNTSALGWNNKSSTAKGMYALGDLEVLENQIVEISKYSVITEFAADELIGTVESLLSDIASIKTLQSIMNATSDVANVAGSIADVVSSCEDMKDSVKKIEDAKKNYDSAFYTFKSATEAYASALKNVEQKEAAQQTAERQQSTAKGNAGRSSADVKRIEKEIESLEALINNSDDPVRTSEYEEKKKEYQKLLQGAKQDESDYDEAQQQADSALKQAKEATKQARVDADQKRESAKKAIKDYAKKTKALKDQMEDAKKKIKAAVTSFEKVASSTNKAVKSVKSVTVTLDNNQIKRNKDDLIENNKKLAESLDNYTDERDKEKIRHEINVNQEHIDEGTKMLTQNGTDSTNYNNEATVIESAISGVQSSFESVMDDYNEAQYGQVINSLEKLHSKVSTMTVDQIESSFKCHETVYYVKITGYPSSASIAEVIKQINDQCSQSEDSELWALLSGFSEFLDGFFKINLFYDSKLDAVIRDDLMGTETGSLGELVDSYLTLAKDLSYMSSHKIKGLVDFFKRIQTVLQDLSNVFKAIWNNITAMFTGIANAASQLKNGLYDKLMVAQYMNLSLANRLSYTGKDVLSGYSFGAAGLSPTTNKSDKLFAVGAFAALGNAMNPNGKRSDMFCGAETEYVLAGSRVEVANQAAVFMNIYLLRLVIDVIFMIGNSEIQKIAHSAGLASMGIGAPLAYTLYILLEPLLDTMFIVNGAEISWYKKCFYLTPTGIPTMISRLSNLGLNKSEQNQITNKIAKALKVGKGKASKDTSVINSEYSDYLFLFLLFQDQDRTLKRFQTMISLEGKKHYGAYFDISKTYTYINAKTEGEYVPFLSIAWTYTNFAFSKTRTQVRGY